MLDDHRHAADDTATRHPTRPAGIVRHRATEPVRLGRSEAGPGGPALDEDGLLRHGGRWVAISDAQLPVVRLLLARRGRLVRDAELLAAYHEAGGHGSRESMRSLVHRVANRAEQVGLELRAVRGRGVVLDVRALHS